MAERITPFPAISRRQGDVLLVIADYILTQRLSPTLKEIRIGMGLASTTNLNNYLQPLVKQGYLSRDSRYVRGAFQPTALAEEILPTLIRGREQEFPGVNGFVQKKVM